MYHNAIEEAWDHSRCIELQALLEVPARLKLRESEGKATLWKKFGTGGELRFGDNYDASNIADTLSDGCNATLEHLQILAVRRNDDINLLLRRTQPKCTIDLLQ